MHTRNAITRRGFFYSVAIGLPGAAFLLQKAWPSFTIPRFWTNLGLGSVRYLGLADDPTVRSRSAPGVTVKRFRTPGKQYATAADTFREDLYSHYKEKKPYPISRIFSLFPFQVTDENKREALIKRGNISFNGTTVSNQGPKLEVQFYDEFLKKIIVVFPQLIKAQVEVLPQADVRLEFDPSHTGLVVLYMLDPNHEIAPNQLLESITFAKSSISYLLHQENKENQKVRIIVDLTMAPTAA